MSKRIIMNFTVPPSEEDLSVMAEESLEHLPEELAEFCDELAVVIEDFPDESLEQELELDDSYELMALYRSGREISPGIERKSANDDDVLILFRRPILDMWCESGDDLGTLLRQLIIEELGKHFDFSEDEIDEMAVRHCQAMF